ncbi:MAG: 50S ribosomal protein L16 [Candidatus Diapherotrites archaeon]|nr:50S ribosomal protein L16 [Candidatus Diapherotrites archaeon]
MPLRPAKCYRSTKKKPSYTRSAVKVHKRNYIGATPGLKIRQFNMGNPLKNFPFILDLICDEKIQIRDNAFEAIRTTINRNLNKKLGKDGYFMKLRIYPFQILRENKQAQGAGADRVTKGMAHPFGKPIGRAARIKKGQVLISILLDKENIDFGRKTLMRVKSKLPCKISVKVHTDVNSLGTKPRKTKEEKVEEKVDATAAAGTATTPAADGKEAAAPATGKTSGKKEEKKK